MKKTFRICLIVAVLLLVWTVTAGANQQASHYKWYRDSQDNAVKYDDRDGTILAWSPDDYASDTIAFPPYAGDVRLTAIADELYKKDSGEWHDFTTVIIPEGIKRIGKSAFQDCTDITRVVLPESLECIDDGAFSGCTGLSDINFPDNISYIGKNAFNGTAITELEIPANTGVICGAAFANCSSLAKVNFHENVTSIEYSAFSGTNLAEVVVPDGLTHIGGYAFSGTPWLDGYDSDYVVVNNILIRYKGGKANAIIPGNAYYIGDCAFMDTEVTGVTFHSKVWGIGNNAFYNTSYLVNMQIPESVTHIGTAVFRGSGIGVVEFPSTITKIPDYTFYNSKINSLCLHENITEIGEYAYSRSSCQGAIPDHVKKIGAHAFEKCGSFKAVLNMTDVEIGTKAFAGNYGITSVTLSGKSIVGEYAFQECMYLKLINIGPEVKICMCGFDWTGISNIDGVSDEIEYIGGNAFTQTTYWNNVKKNDFVIAGDGNLLSVYCKDATADVVIPEGVKRICGGAFRNVQCNRVILPSTLEVIRSNAFGVVTGYGSTITEIVLPDKEFVIEPYAFQNCSTLEKINFPKWLKVIPEYAFEGCDNLVLDSIDGVEEIGDWGLAGVQCLKDGVLPKSVKKLGTSALAGCFDTDIYLEHIPEEMGDCPFGFAENKLNAAVYVKLHVPEGLLDCNPDWNEYTLIVHTSPEIIDSGDGYVTMYFKTGIYSADGYDLLEPYYVTVGNTSISSFADFEVIDDYTIRLNNAANRFEKTIEFENMISNGDYLTKYDPMVIESMYINSGEDTEDDADDFTFTRKGVIVSYNGSAQRVVIPAELDGTAIKTIATDAFKSGNVCIYIPESIQLLQKDFAKYGNTIVCFEGELPTMELGALGDYMQLYNKKFSHSTAEGYTMRKCLTENRLYSPVSALVVEEYYLQVYVYAEPAQQDNAVVISRVTFEDGTEQMYIDSLTRSGFNLIRHKTDKKISDAKVYIWDKSNIIPLAYSDISN